MDSHATTEDTEEDPTKLFQEPVREKLINTAVKFLQNPRVRPTTLSQKQKFLKNKGLTDEEIKLACQKAGAFVDEENNMRVARTYYEKPSVWIKAKDVANLVALFSIGSYSLYSLWKNYVAPRLFGTRSRNQRNYETLLEAIGKLNQNVVELKELIRELQGPPGALSAIHKNSYEFQEIKNEIKSIKSLLLNRNQFPSTPSPGIPAIPSWQMHDTSPKSADADRNLTGDDDEASTSRRKKNKSSKPHQRKPDPMTTSQDILSFSESGSIASASGDVPEMRKNPSVDSNDETQSRSSCEVVFVGGKHDSEPDHSDE